MNGTTLTRPLGDARAVAGARDLAADRAYCRAVLPRVSRTFAINIRLLSGSFGEAVRVAYLLCRVCDALEDSWPGGPRDIERRFDRFLESVHGERAAAEELARGAASLQDGRADLELVANLDRVLGALNALPAEDRAPILDSLHVMAEGMRRYAVRGAVRSSASAGAFPGVESRGTEPSAPAPYLDTPEELHQYCFVVAGCVGVMLTRLFTWRAPAGAAVQARRIELAPVVGEALQLTNILLDWPIDLRRGRCHVPARWLAELDLIPSELAGLERPGVRALAARIEGMARDALARVPEYLDTIPPHHVRYRLFCLWPALWALASLRHARRDPDFPWGSRRPRLPRTTLWSTALASLFFAHDGRALRRRLADAEDLQAAERSAGLPMSGSGTSASGRRGG